LLRKIAAFASGNVIVQIIPFIFYPIIARIFSVDDFGLLALFAAITSACSYFLTFQYMPAIVKCEKSEITSLVSISLFSSFIVSLILVGVSGYYLPLVNEDFSRLFEIKNIELFLVIFLVMSTFIEIKSFTYVRDGKFTHITLINLFKVICLYSVLLIFRNNEHILILSQVASLVMAVAFIFVFKSGVSVSLDLSAAKYILKKYSEFPKYRIPHAVFDVISVQGIIFFITIFYGLVEVAIFTMVTKLLRMPINVVFSAIAKVIYSELCGEKKSIGFGRDVRLYLLLGLVFLFSFFILYLFGHSIFVFVLGDKWSMSGELAESFSFMYMFLSLSIALSFVPAALGKQKHFLWITTVGNLLILSTVLISGSLGIEFSEFGVYYSVTASVVYISYFIFNIYILVTNNGIKLAEK